MNQAECTSGLFPQRGIEKIDLLEEEEEEEEEEEYEGMYTCT